MRTSRLVVATFSAAAFASANACGSDAASTFGGSIFEGPDASTEPVMPFGDGGTFNGEGGTQKPIASLTIEPPTASLEVVNGVVVTQAFKAIAHYTDNTSGPLGKVTWSATDAPVGGIDAAGLYTPHGAQGGTVTVSAGSGSAKATAKLTVKIHVIENPAGAAAGVQASLKGATALDGSVVWQYPYDKTVMPRGLNAPLLMWKNGGASDVYYVHVSSPTYELESFATAPAPSRFTIDAQKWTDFTNSTTGAADLQVVRWSGAAATQITKQTWTVADGTMRGTIYYWAINKGRVVRIKPGATAPDDFLATLQSGGVSQTCPACHTVSADGSSLLMNITTSNWPHEDSMNYSLKSAATTYDGFHVDTGTSQWAFAAVTPDGKTLVENYAPLRGTPPSVDGAYDTVTTAKLLNSGFDGLHPWMPAFSPDNRLFTYVQEGGGDLHSLDWNGSIATNDRLLVTKGTDASLGSIQFPTLSPDHKWVVYQRGPALGSLGIPGDLYAAPTDGSSPEVRLRNLNGDDYPFAAGSRDSDLSYEPTFAPVASGGYFWVVFHARRTYGNQLTGPAYVGEGNGTKQLWVAAIDQNPKAGQDPSHPGFWLPGQDLTTLNMRGYWALDPCKGNGTGCASGTECCGGFCDATGDAGTAVCGSQSTTSCSQNGDKCSVTSDCCNASGGTVCINSVCSEPPPK